MEDTKVEQYVTEKDTVETLEEIKGGEALDTIEDTKPGPFVWLCAAATAIGGMLFGYDTVCLSWNGFRRRPLSTDVFAYRVSFLAFSSSSGLILTDDQ